ncbi:MAG: hypothetical protein ACM3S0_11075 [Acidobacteriota bacterium]
MSDSTHDLLVRGIAAAKTDSKAEARFYLEWVTRSSDADRDEITQAWRWLATISDDPKQKRECLEQALAYDPLDPEVHRALAILDGKLDPADIVNPDRLPAPAASEQRAQARRFVCSQCGGRMEFDPDGTSLTCAYCHHHMSLADLSETPVPEEQDFTIALAMAKGHSAPVATQALKCQGCGASFVLPPCTLSTVCPYCGSPYVIEQMETRELVAPDGVIPFAVTQDEAAKTAFRWYRANGLKMFSGDAEPVGVYLPVWTFDLAGEVAWSYRVEKREEWVSRSGSSGVFENDVPVAASHTLSAALSETIGEFPFDKIAPYDPRFLADWPAETYQIPVSDASLVARSRTVAKKRKQIDDEIGEGHKDLVVSSARLFVESFKLVLVPVWIARYQFDHVWYSVVVNGQLGTLRADKPVTGVRKWLSGLLGDP